MYFQRIITLLNSSTVLVGGGESEAQPAVEAAGDAVGGWFGAIGPTTILLYAALFGVLWFFLIRPQRKREKEMRDMQQALKVGDNVLTSSGMFGVITALGEDCFIVEFGLNKGIRVPVRKMDIIGVKEPTVAPVKEIAEK